MRGRGRCGLLEEPLGSGYRGTGMAVVADGEDGLEGRSSCSGQRVEREGGLLVATAGGD